MKHARVDKRLLMTKNLILMFVMLVVIVLAVLSWFSFTKTVTANNITVRAKANDEVEICLADEFGNANKVNGHYDFKTENVITDVVDFIKDATSDGKDFIVPQFNVTQSSNEGKIVNENAAAANAIPFRNVKQQVLNNPDSEIDYHYLSYEMYIRSKVPDVRILESSYVASALETDYSNATSLMANTGGNVDYRPAKTYAPEDSEFSADALVGAIRVSMVGEPWNSPMTLENLDEEDYEEYTTDLISEPCQFLWLPRPDVKLNIGGNIGQWTLSTGLTDTTKSNYKHTFYRRNTDSVTPVTLSKGVNTVGGKNYYLNVSSPTAKSSSGGPRTPVPVLGEDKDISSFNTTATPRVMDGNEYYLYRYTLNIWIEGADDEARRAMGDGMFNINLVFGS
jgi:hypothetical protein